MEGYLEVMEINQEKMEAVTEHYEELPCAETMHVLTTLQYWTCNVLHEDPTGRKYETTGEAEGLFGGPASGHRVPQSTESMDPSLWWNLAEVCHCHWTNDPLRLSCITQKPFVGNQARNSATAYRTKHKTVARPRKQEATQADSRAESCRAGSQSSIKLWNTSDRTWWRSWPLLKWKKTTKFTCWNCGSTSLHQFCPHKSKEEFGDMPMGYSRWAALRRNQCDMMMV